MQSLKLTSCVSEQTDPLCRAMADYLTKRLELQVDFFNDASWPDRLAALIAGEIDLGWLCGLLYAQLSEETEPPLTLLAAPVMQESRYASRAIYFSDVVVRRSSGIERFEELRGATLAFNEPNSFSGYHLLRLHLAEQGETLAFFLAA